MVGGGRPAGPSPRRGIPSGLEDLLRLPDLDEEEEEENLRRRRVGDLELDLLLLLLLLLDPLE